MDGNLFDWCGVVASLILCHIVEVICLFRLQPCNVKGHIFLCCYIDTATLEGIHTICNLYFSGITGQIYLARLPSHRLGIDLARVDNDPIEGAILIQVRIETYRLLLHLVDRCFCDKDWWGLIYRSEGQLLDCGTLPAINICEPQIEVIGLQLLQRHTVDIKTIRCIFGHIQCTIAQISADRICLEILSSGGCCALGQQCIVEATGLCGHHSNLTRHICYFGHIGIACCKVWYRIVWSCEGNNLQRALCSTGIYQDTGEIVRTICNQLGNLYLNGAVGTTQFYRTILYNFGRIGRWVNQICRLNRTICQRRNRPIYHAFLVCTKLHCCGSRCKVCYNGIASQNSGVSRGFCCGCTVHQITSNGSCVTWADGDLVRKHTDGAVWCIDNQMTNIAATADTNTHI